MSSREPRAVYQVAGMATKVGALGTLPTVAPTVKTQAQGKVNETAFLTIEVSGACLVTLWLFSPASLSWINMGSSSASYQKTFTGKGGDFFTIEPGTLFYVQSDTAAITAYSNCDPVEGYRHA